MGKYFGTDGVRGIAGEDLSCELAMKIGRGAAAVLTDNMGRKPRILIGKDTRISGDMLEAALTAGLCSVGADVESLGVVPTPAVAYLVRKYHADAGIVISASHNPMEFNGIKIFAGTGYKLPDEVEALIEAHIDNDCRDIPLATGADVGHVSVRSDGVRDYVDYLYEAVGGSLAGLKVCIDCANGASAAVAQQLFPRLGAHCTFLGVSPDGVNINRGVGSTHLENLEKAVVDGGFDCGVAFDGDADRCLACDEKGQEIDGDKIIALLSMERKINQRGLDVEADIPEDSVMVRGDNELITQVVYNLLENATKFAAEGSTLYLGLACRGEKAVVTVRNTGNTIPAQEIPLLFERFHKSDKSRSEDKDGYGLGLYVVKTILNQHKEQITVTSENGVTAFSFTVQMADSARDYGEEQEQ